MSNNCNISKTAGIVMLKYVEDGTVPNTQKIPNVPQIDLGKLSSYDVNHDHQARARSSVG
jgi:hypothetical protein